MDAESAKSSSAGPVKASNVESPSSTVSMQSSSPNDTPSTLSTSSISSWARSLSLPHRLMPGQEETQAGNSARSTFARLADGFGLNLATKNSGPNKIDGDTSEIAQPSVIGSLTKGLVDSSMGAVKAVQVKARHIVSQNKRRYQEGGFDLDMTYITENIIAMGFPAGDMSSGFFGFVEGFYRNHMEEVIKFFETHHKGKYKVYNLCSERLYDASLFEGKVASFPFDDHNCPPIHLIPLFCQSSYSWLKEDILNVVVVHCKAGKGRTGLMICSLLLFLKFFPTAEECIDYYNQKRCVDGKGLILPSQIRYVKYFESILKKFNGETPPGRRCMLRGFRLHNCPYWVRPSITISDHNDIIVINQYPEGAYYYYLDSNGKSYEWHILAEAGNHGILFSTRKHPKTKDLMPDDFWIRAPRIGIVVFALPGQPGLTELVGDFKIHFHDSHGDFYCWLNTTMMENRVILKPEDLDGFNKRKLPAPGFQVEVVVVDYDGTTPTKYNAANSSKRSDGRSSNTSASSNEAATYSNQSRASENQGNDDVFSDSDGEETTALRNSLARTASGARVAAVPQESGTTEEQTVTRGTEQLSLNHKSPVQSNASGDKKEPDIIERQSSIPNLNSGDIKAIAADASVFSFGDDEDSECE